MAEAAPHPRTWRRTAFRWVLCLLVVWVGVVLVMAWLENSLVYHPDRVLVPPPAADVEDVWFNSADGTKLHGWWLPGEARNGAVLVSHGNGGNLAKMSLDFCFAVPATDRLVVQETHETLYHILWELVHIFFEHEGLLT